MKGFLTGSVIEIPLLASGVWLLARFGATDPEVGFMRMMRLTAVFAGIAAIFTAAGVGRLAAYASVDKIGGRRHAIFVAARAHAAAGAGLLIIATIPNGHLPDHASGWLVMPLVGALVGAVSGAMIGVVCGGAAPVGIAEVLALARTPGHKLRQLLDPEDLMKIGHAVRQRTQQMVMGMFEPQKKAPGSDDDHDANLALGSTSEPKPDTKPEAKPPAEKRD